MLPEFRLKAGDTSPPIQATLLDADENAVDINGATVRFSMAELDTGELLIARAAASNDQNGDGSDGSRGRVSYDWQAAQGTAPGDTDAPGLYVGEWEITFADPDASVETFPNDRSLVIYIAAQLA